MYACLCKGVSDKKIRELAAMGCKSLKSVQKMCLAGTDCGVCVLEIKKILQEDQQQTG